MVWPYIKMNRIRTLRNTLMYNLGQSRTRECSQIQKEKGKSWEETKKERL
jgi:hypothetical protein